MASNGSHTRTLVLRVLQIAHPVSCIIPNYDGFVNEPRAGELMTMGLGDEKSPWWYNVDTGGVNYGGAAALPSKRRSGTRLIKGEMAGLSLLFDYQTAL
jgi:hypothetical protein